MSKEKELEQRIKELESEVIDAYDQKDCWSKSYDKVIEKQRSLVAALEEIKNINRPGGGGVFLLTDVVRIAKEALKAHKEEV